MNLKTRLEHIAMALSMPLGYGKTTVLAKACKELDATLLTYNFQDATRVKREHGIHAESIDKNLSGLSGPFFIDHYAASTLLNRAASKIEELEAKIEELEKCQR